jgi:CRISPR-associated protein Cas2
MYFLIAYDIADPRRLQRVARFMERRACRCQKSVFLFQGDWVTLERLLDEVVPLLSLKEDIVQAWKISADQPLKGHYRGTPVPLDPASAVLIGGRIFLVDK